MAGRPCTVCQHPDRPSIDMAMANHKPFRAISRQFGVSKDAVLRTSAPARRPGRPSLAPPVTSLVAAVTPDGALLERRFLCCTLIEWRSLDDGDGRASPAQLDAVVRQEQRIVDFDAVDVGMVGTVEVREAEALVAQAKLGVLPRDRPLTRNDEAGVGEATKRQ